MAQVPFNPDKVDRDQRFEAAGRDLRTFFKPRSVAVIGASRNPDSIGGKLIEALTTNHFQGAIYPVNPHADTLGGLPVVKAVCELPDGVELAILAVPARFVLEVVEECAQKKIPSLLVISAGFAEIGCAGREAQRQLIERARAHGMRLIGPNCMGLLNTDPTVRLNASFSPIFPPRGRVAMSSQSGALGLAILSMAKRYNIGLSTFVSVGNKADVSGNDLIQYWNDDPDTDVILLYLESFGNPRKFARIARQVTRNKPIVAVKGGRSKSGGRAAGSHTAALASNDVAVEALFRQTGVIRADTLEEMFDLAALLGSQPLPLGRRVAIVTNAGGPGILCADRCEEAGLMLPEPTEQTRYRLSAFLPATAGLSNPIDMIASATASQFQQAIATLLQSREFDMLIAIYIPVGLGRSEDIESAICAGVTSCRSVAPDVPVVACLMLPEGGRTQLNAGGEKIPCYPFPENVGDVFGKVAEYSIWRRSPLGSVPHFADLRILEARSIIDSSLREDGAGWLSARRTFELLEAFHLPAAPGGVATSPDEAVELAHRVGYPVALKLASRWLTHKTEVGGVRLRLEDQAAVRSAFEEIRQNVERAGPAHVMEGVVVQPMVSGGVEVMIGVTHDPSFGPLLAFGLGGVHVEILGDVHFRVTPLTERDAREMIQGIRGYRLLQGYRGHPPADLDALVECLLRVSKMVEEVPQIMELDLNPILALPPGQGCRLVDARIKLAP